ncbi:MAG: NAD(P)-dependent oxidoreductase [Desulfobacteraceae bacterium]|nr:MAG: NAD(P)-dependent oxidoreductase [Desulfobacteraceae bacterium]
MKEKVVVIGGAGFLGSHLSDSLTEAGYTVSIFDIRSSPWLRPGQEMTVGDIRDENALGKCLKGAHYVYHLAGIADIGEALKSPKTTVEYNIIGSTIVLDACLKAKVERLLFASTIYVYSQKGSFYRVSKQAVESLIEAYYEQYGLEYTILRYGSLYGPRAQEWNGLKRYVTQAVREGRIVYPGTGEEKREYIHVKDAAQLSVAALASEYANQCLTLTGTQILNFKELLHMIREILGGRIELEFRPEKSTSAHYDMTPYRFTPKVARKMVPNVFVDIGQGILDLVEEVYQENNSKIVR